MRATGKAVSLWVLFGTSLLPQTPTALAQEVPGHQTIESIGIAAKTSPVATRTASDSESGSGFFDLGWARLYIAVRVGVSIPTAALADGLDLGRGDLYAASVGVDLGRFTSAELAFNGSEYGISSSELGSVGEWAAYTFIPALRLRYPLVRDRLVPHVVGGIGVGWSEFNDRRTDRLQAGAEPSLAGFIGGGLEYFIARNLTVGVDAKYQFLDRQIGIDGEGTDAATRALLLAATLRASFPETPPAGFESVEWREVDPYGLRVYMALRFGVRLYSSDGFGPGAVKGGAVFAGPGTSAAKEQTNSGSVGLGINRYLAFEVAAETHDFPVHADLGDVKLAEYGTWNVLGQILGRYPVARGRLVPYALLGLGFSKSDINDRTLENGVEGPELNGGGWGSVWAAGLGIDYVLASNVALVGELKYLNGKSPSDVDGADVEVDISAFLPSLGFRVYLN